METVVAVVDNKVISLLFGENILFENVSKRKYVVKSHPSVAKFFRARPTGEIDLT